MKVLLGLLSLFLAVLLGAPTIAAQTDLSSEASISVSNSTKQIALPLIPGVDEFKILATTNLSTAFAPAAGGSVSGYVWQDPSGLDTREFFQVEVIPKSSRSVLAATVLQRLAYGPTPDEIERISEIGPDAYIAEQMAPESIQEDLAIDKVNLGSDWEYVTVTGSGSSSTLYIYLKGTGDCYIDNLKLVRGAVPEAGTNMLVNGAFDTDLTGWTISTNLSESHVTPEVTHSGGGALHLISSSSGESRDSSIYQTIRPSLTTSGIYTLSYWYKPGTNRDSGLVVRLSGNGITSSPNSLGTRLELGSALLEDLRAWHVLRAIQSKKQLMEVLLQFFENHFVTQHKKSKDYLDQYYSGDDDDKRATRMEYMENKLWRQALLNPSCTFHDLLKISAESPAMIIYLDTVGSKGSGSNIANENYARELLELFTFGVDNGYDQNDITVLSRAWTGWSVRIVDPENEFNPFAPQSTTLRPGGTNRTRIENLEGVWAFTYKASNHNNSQKVIFPGKTVPPRFGPPYAGRSYELILPARSGTNSIQDGYDVLRHLADQPFTQEFISVKLCRLFVHDDFAEGYDFTSPNLSPEGQLVRECMRAWEENVPRGQIRKVLEIIFNSDLFRSQSASMQKVKTPFEFVVSAIRALRAADQDGTFTAESDGYSMYNPMNRAGRMRLFDRDNPDGYPESGAPWISAGTLAERLRFVQALLIPAGQSGRSDAGNNTVDPVRLLKLKLPQSDWNNAAAVADYFTRTIYPSEGLANLDDFRREAIAFLNTSENGNSPSPFSSIANTTSVYDLRVRGMVAMLLTYPRFQEQ